MADTKSKSQHLPSTARSLPIALIRARESIMPPIREMLAESGITEQQWRVLRVLQEFGPQSTSTIAERASLLLPSLTRIAQKMMENDLITVTRDDADRRRQTISITPNGQKIIDENQARANEIVDELRTRLGANRYEKLLDLLAELDPQGKN